MEQQGESLLKCLIADDSRFHRNLIRDCTSTKLQNAQVIEAADGTEALRIISEERPDLIFLDNEMPGLSGVQVAAKIRCLDERYIPYILMVTSLNNAGEALEGGCDDFIRKPFNPDEMRARITVALRIIAVYQKMRRQTEEMERLARIDSLTGLYNRRMIDERLREAVEEARRKKRELTLCMCDVDGFKKINDTYGHIKGDEILVALASCLRSCLRLGDFLARYGGDEFFIIFYETGGDVAPLIERRLHSVAASIKLPDGAPLSVSLGLWSGLPKESDEPEALLKKADNALYENKGQRTRLNGGASSRQLTPSRLSGAEGSTQN